MTDQPATTREDFARVLAETFDVPLNIIGDHRRYPNYEDELAEKVEVVRGWVTDAIPDMRAWAAISVPLAAETFEIVDAFDVPAHMSPNLKKILELELELRDAKAEIARLRAGEADHPGDPAAAATPAQWLRRFNDLPADQRLTVAEKILSTRAAAEKCFILNHEGHIEHLTARIHTLEMGATVDRRAHEAELEQAHRDAATARVQGLREAAEEIRTEARWQLTLKRGGGSGMFDGKPLDPVERLQVLDRILTDRADALQ